jgi:tRNA pseudouridine13 synthase
LKAGFILSEFKYIWPLNQSNDFVFNPSSRDFLVEEIPLYEFSGEGEHLILKVRKKNLTTWEMIDTLSSHLGLQKKEIGYAGLKDKHAITFQYISMPKRLESKLDSFSHENIKILQKQYHNNKIRVGHLKGNKFWMRFKKVLDTQKTKIESVLEWIEQNGMPNYFGVQRFGITGKNYLEGKDIVDGKLRLRDRKKREFLVSSYQSFLFNNWLASRINLSTLINTFSQKEVENILNLPKDSLANIKEQKNYFKLLEGDLFMHYPYGRVFYEEVEVASKRFLEKDISPTGLIAGKKVKKATGVAEILEKEYDYNIKENGSRRYAWIFPEITKKSYNPQNAWYELEFYLPKGSYATVLVDFLKGNIVD